MLTAIIPVRSGSKRLKNKNILPFKNSNLLVHKIRQLKQIHGIDCIVVSSDSDTYLDMAKSENVNIHKREIEYSDEITRSFGEVVAKICSDVKGDDILWSPCVSPLIRLETYQNAIETYYKNIPLNNDSLVSVEILKWFLWDDKGPINYGFGSKHVKSQDLPNIYHPTNGIFIAPRLKMIEWKYFHGENPYKYIIDKIQAIDIDDEIDLKICRILAEN